MDDNANFILGTTILLLDDATFSSEVGGLGERIDAFTRNFIHCKALLGESKGPLIAKKPAIFVLAPRIEH